LVLVSVLVGVYLIGLAMKAKFPAYLSVRENIGFVNRYIWA